MNRLSLLVAAVLTVFASPVAAADLTGMWEFNYEPWMKENPGGFHGSGQPPSLTPWAKEEMAKAREARRGGYVRSLANMKCIPLGFPTLMQYRTPLQILQAGPWVTMLSEDSIVPRTIYMNSTEHPDDIDPSWTGHSIGRWEGETLVVETVGFNDRAWLSFYDRVPKSEKAKITERISLTDGGKTLVDELTIEDPQSLLAPWRYTLTYKRMPDDTPRLEAICEVDLDAIAKVDLKALSAFDAEARRMLDPELQYNPKGQ